ncbi:MAG: CsiV family protein [Endozoicomonas sp. (ex Botrylloides leachii)]|nr:CsiV family protein [Endozoicomonas sp. (ex Botrylloides leachii)]
MKQAVITLLLALLYSSVLFAETISAPSNPLQQAEPPPWYQVDIIIFRNDASIKNTTEKWLKPSAYTYPAGAITLASPTPAVVADAVPSLTAITNIFQQPSPPLDLARDPFIALPDNDQQLNEEASLLNSSANYTVLDKIAWRLPVDPKTKAQPVRIQSQPNANETYLVNGTVTVSSYRFLHVDIDLWYDQLQPDALSTILMQKSEPKPDEISTNMQKNRSLFIVKSFHLKQIRRIQRTSEIQYFDTPVIGVLLKLTPYKKPVDLGILSNSAENT